MSGGASSPGSAMLFMATPLIDGRSSIDHGPTFATKSSSKPNSNWESQQRRLRKEKEEMIRSDKAYVADLERTRLPLVFPDNLHLCKAQVGAHEGDGKLATSCHGFKIANNASAEALLIGFRYGRGLKKNIHHIALCLGADWYGSSSGPFLKASYDRNKSFIITYRSEYPDAKGRRVRTIITTGSKQGTVFEMVVPDLAENIPTLQRFEWRHRQNLVAEDQEPKVGAFLVQHSTTQPPQRIARMDWGDRKPHRGLISDFNIAFMGAGTAYGGTWKTVAFVIGIFAFQ